MSKAENPHGIVALFFRGTPEGGEVFYPIQFMGNKPAAEEAVDHAVLNPGTLRIEDMQGNTLWSASRTQGETQ